MEPSEDFQQQQVGQPAVVPPVEPVSASVRPPSRWSGIIDLYRANKWYVWAIVLGLVIIGVLAYFALRPTAVTPTTEANVAVTIDAPMTAAAGSEVIYKIKLENNDRANLEHLELELVYPSGGSYVSSTPKASNLSGTRFAVPDLGSGQNAAVIVKAKIEGNLNDEKKLTAVLHYNYSNFSSEFQKQVVHTVRLTAADIGITMSGPQESTNAEQVSYTVNYINDSDRDISNARVQVTYPEGFVFADGSPKPDLAKNIWNIATLPRGGNGRITFQGTFKQAQPGQTQTFVAEFLVLDNQNNFNSQAKADHVTTISALPLVVTQSLDSQNTAGIVKPGDELHFTLKYSNTANIAASGVNIVVTLDSKALDFSTIRAEDGEVSNNVITWNASGVGNLERLNPNESGNLRFSVQVKNPAVKDSSKNIAIKSSAKIRSNEYSTFLPGNDVDLKVSSPAAVAGDARHVSGQLPLQVGKNSTFEVKVTLRNSTNDFTSAVLTGFVPTGAQFDSSSINVKEAANVTYDPSTGKLTWKVGTLAAHTGNFNPLRTLTFNVRVNPSASQANQELNLFRTINFTAKDSFTEQDIKLSTEDVKTTDIPNGFSDGRVQQ